jgi:hypothetical protein
MHHLSMVQALSIWSDLCAAYHGKNGYGGNVAEIYIYRLMADDPSACGDVYGGRKSSIGQRAEAERVTRANASLFALLSHFEERHEGAAITVNTRTLGPWILNAGFDHRVHVKITGCVR